MDTKTEIEKVEKMLRGGGFKLLDVQFEGAMVATDKRVVAVINKMAERQEAFGVFHIYYESDGDTRVIDIPVGVPPEPAEEK